MNGIEPKIEIFKPFGEAFELTKKILFQPFDIKKWFVIGFAAFLASFSGGFQSSFNPFSRWNMRQDRGEIIDSFRNVGSVDYTEGWVIALILIGLLIFLALVFVLMWIGARGRFIFIDCIVYNRGAIVAPWKQFRRQGNSFFLFSLLVAVVIIGLLALAVLPIVVPIILKGSQPQLGVGFWVAFSLFILFVLLICVSWALISQLMVPIMYRQGCLARDAFGHAIRLVVAHPGPMILYFLFLIVLGLAAVMVSCLATCVTCCIAAIPYIGTVVLLPIHVMLYGFTLLFLRQFGPDYDVWAGISQREVWPLPPAPPPIQT